MKSITYLAPTGMLGAGFTEELFRAALSSDLAFIGCDSGSCDGGPCYLGGNYLFISRQGVKRDLRLLLIGARQLGIPLLIGSCGGSGSNAGLDWTWDIVKEISREECLAFRAALIYAEPDRSALIAKWRAGKITPLEPAPDVNECTLTDATRIVAMMGPEAFLSALAGGAEVVLAGRSTDASIFAAIPLRDGFDPGLCWHAAKILECGGAAVTAMDRPEGMICTIHPDRFVVRPVSASQRCSPSTVASHALYETGNPYRMKEPGGELDLATVRYTQVPEDDRAVAVTGSRFHREPYTVRLEGAALVGYRSISIGGIRDPVLLGQLDGWLADADGSIRRGIDQLFHRDMREEYRLDYRAYGRDGILGKNEPLRNVVPHEVGLLISVVAADQNAADAIAGFASHRLLHHAVPQWKGLVSNLAFPLSPHVLPVGPAYSFVLNHVAHLKDPLEFFAIRYEDIGR